MTRTLRKRPKNNARQGPRIWPWARNWMHLPPHAVGSYWTTRAWTKSQMTEFTILLTPALCCRQSSRDSSLATSCAPANIYVLFEVPMGEDPQEFRGGHSPAKSRNGLALTITSQRITSCELPKTEPVGDALQSTVLHPNDDGETGTDTGFFYGERGGLGG